MIKEILIQYLPSVLYLAITVFIGIITYFVKQFLLTKKDLLEHQRNELIQKIGIDKYNHDMEIAKGIINAVEQEAREFDWDSVVKHSTATKMIRKMTGLSDSDIYNIIKSTVNEFNKDNYLDKSKNADTKFNVNVSQ